MWCLCLSSIESPSLPPSCFLSLFSATFSFAFFSLASASSRVWFCDPLPRSFSYATCPSRVAPCWQSMRPCLLYRPAWHGGNVVVQWRISSLCCYLISGRRANTSLARTKLIRCALEWDEGITAAAVVMASTGTMGNNAMVLFRESDFIMHYNSIMRLIRIKLLPLDRVLDTHSSAQFHVCRSTRCQVL